MEKIICILALNSAGIGLIIHRLFIIQKKLNKIMKTNEQFILDLQGMKTELDGFSTNFDALEAAITANTDNVPQPVLDAFTALKGSADSFNTKLSNALAAAQPPESAPASDSTGSGPDTPAQGSGGDAAGSADQQPAQ